MKRKDTGLVNLKKKGGIVKEEKAYHMLTRREDRHWRLRPLVEAHVKQKAGVLGTATPHTHCTDKNQTQRVTKPFICRACHTSSTCLHINYLTRQQVGQHYRCFTHQAVNKTGRPYLEL